MDFKNLSPAYLSSLGAVLVSALMIGSGVSWMLWVGWLLLLLAVGLNVFAHLVTVSKMKGEPAPAMLTNLEQRFEAMREKADERSEEPIEGEPDFDGDPLDSEATVELGSETPKKKSVLPSKIEDSQSSSRPTVR